MKINGQEVLQMYPDQLRKNGLGIVPEDRYLQGLCLSMPVSSNLIAGYHGQEKFCHHGIMDKKSIRKNMDKLVDEYDIRLSKDDPEVSQLSGGNGQKVIIAREFSSDPSVLLMSQPTRGVDVGATAFIYKNILRMRDENKAILLISSELSEVKSLADRIIVFHNGEIVGEFIADDVSFYELGLYMSGAKSMRDPA